MKPLKLWKIIPSLEGVKGEDVASKNEYIVDVAAKWADHRFSTEDGRRFAYIANSDSILRRALTLGHLLTRRERALLEKGSIAGAIVELGSGEPPMLYGDFDTLKSDWLELHESFGAPLTEEESIAFGIVPAESEWETGSDLDEMTY